MQPSQAWIEALAELRAAGTPAALVVVTHVVGSAPREVGARMVVAGGRPVWGTIGGGELERLALEHAVHLLARGAAAAESLEVPLAEAAGQCCGGKVSLLVEAFPWRRPTLAIFGAGHVGQALAGLAPWLGADVRVIDARAPRDLVPTPAPDRPWRLVTTNAPEEELDELPADALVVVMTHSHALDLSLIARALRRGVFPYLGLIGSERKWKRFQKALRNEGLEDAAIARVVCPIGRVRGAKFPGAKEPGAIALAVAAELVEHRALAAR